MKKHKVYDFQKFETIISFGKETDKDELKLEDAFEKQVKVKNEIDKFKEFTK